MQIWVLIRFPQEALIYTVLIEVGSTIVRYFYYGTVQDRPGEETGGVLLTIFPGETALLVCAEMQPHRLCCTVLPLPGGRGHRQITKNRR
jgi:hypothetical protein